MTDEASQTPLGFELASEELFDPTKDPFLKKGRVSAAYNATPEQIADAEMKLKQRRQHWNWSMFRPEDAEPLIAVLEELIKEARSVAQETAASTTDGTDRVAAERRQDPLAPAPEEITAVIDAIRERRAAWKGLAFYPDGRLIHLDAAGTTESKRFVFMNKYTQRIALEGGSLPIHEINKAMPIALSDDNVEEYVAFFTEHVHGDEGPFLVIEEDRPQAARFPANLTVTTCDPREGENLKQKVAEFQESEHIKPDRPYVARRFRAEIGWPLTYMRKDNKDRWVIAGTLVYSDQVFRAAFAVEPDGTIEMLEDQPLNEPVFTPIQLAWPKRPSPDSNRRVV